MTATRTMNDLRLLLIGPPPGAFRARGISPWPRCLQIMPPPNRSRKPVVPDAVGSVPILEELMRIALSPLRGLVATAVLGLALWPRPAFAQAHEKAVAHPAAAATHA